MVLREARTHVQVQKAMFNMEQVKWSSDRSSKIGYELTGKVTGGKHTELPTWVGTLGRLEELSACVDLGFYLGLPAAVSLDQETLNVKF